MMAFYRQAIGARRAIDPAAPLQWLDTGRDDVLAFRRAAMVSVTVFAGAPFAPPPGWGAWVLRSDYRPGSNALPANSTGWLRV